VLQVAHALAASAALQLHLATDSNVDRGAGQGEGGGDAQWRSLQAASLSVRQAREVAADVAAAAAAAGRVVPPPDKCDALVTASVGGCWNPP
jgi:hypothetical protein